MFIALLALGSPALAACPTWYTAGDLAASVARAQSAYVVMDLDGFKAAYVHAKEVVPCLSQVLTPPDAAALHRLVALDGWVSQDQKGALDAFRAARSIQPAFVLPGTVAPAGNPLYELYQRALDPGGASSALPVRTPEGYTAFVDGATAAQRPADRPAVVQLISSAGETMWSAWLPAGAPDPDWSSFEPPSVVTAPVAMTSPASDAPLLTTSDRRSPRVPLVVGAGITALASGALYGAAVVTRSRFDDPATPVGDVVGLRDTTNTLVYASAGVGVAALGLGALAVVSVRW